MNRTTYPLTVTQIPS